MKAYNITLLCIPLTDMQRVTPEATSMAYFINPPHQSILPILVRQQLGRHSYGIEYIQYNCLHIHLSLLASKFPWQWRIAGGIVSYAVHVILKESRWFLPELPVFLNFCLYVLPCFLYDYTGCLNSFFQIAAYKMFLTFCQLVGYLAIFGSK
jgi:hypothetical protein